MVEVRAAGLLADFAAAAAMPPDRRSCREDTSLVTLTIAVRLKRVGRETQLLIEGKAHHPRTAPDRSLLRLLAQAHQFRARVMQGRGQTIAALAAEAGVGASYFTRIVRSGFLAPDVVTAILQGRQPPELNAKQLSLHIRLPIGWNDQVAALGIR